MTAICTGLDHLGILKLATQMITPQFSLPTEYKVSSGLLSQKKAEIEQPIMFTKWNIIQLGRLYQVQNSSQNRKFLDGIYNHFTTRPSPGSF
jgi:hypothetical protein